REDSLTSQEGEVHPWSSAVHRVSSRNEDPRTTSPRKARQWTPPPLPRSPPRFLTERGYGKQLHHHGRYIGREDGRPAVHRILHGTDRPLLPAPTHESAHSPHAIFLPGLTQNPGSHRPGPA